MLRRGASVAVLGSGLMGSSVALLLARHGVRVVVFDRDDVPCNGASRWNEGKIHLGYLYGADPSLATARKVIPGGLRFAPLVEDLLAIDLAPHTTQQDDRYVVHRRSVVGLEQVRSVARAVTELAATHPDAADYLAAIHPGRVRPLTDDELEAGYDTTQIVGGLVVPERSVATVPIADAVVDALHGTAAIELLTAHDVAGVRRADDARWRVVGTTPTGRYDHGPFDLVVNALWEGRPAIDVTAGLPGPAACTHRYRVSLFATSATTVRLPNSVVAVGPFGDVKNYDGRRLYLSWYPAGLLAEGEGVHPPPTPSLTPAARDDVAAAVLTRLGGLLPPVADLAGRLEDVEVRGGWVYADGTGALDRADSDLHRRDRIGVTRQDGYVSIDTGKYSIAPWLAEQLVGDLTA